MSIKRAVTFGVKYRNEDHPKLGKLAHPDGYIVVEVAEPTDLYVFLAVVCGQEKLPDGRDGAVLYAFDYDLEEFEAPGGSAELYHPEGRLAEFTALPLHAYRSSLAASE
jgi:hypothetical protein